MFLRSARYHTSCRSIDFCAIWVCISSSSSSTNASLFAIFLRPPPPHHHTPNVDVCEWCELLRNFLLRGWFGPCRVKEIRRVDDTFFPDNRWARAEPPRFLNNSHHPHTSTSMSTHGHYGVCLILIRFFLSPPPEGGLDLVTNRKGAI